MVKNIRSGTRRLAQLTLLASAIAITGCGLAGAADKSYVLPDPTVDAPLAKAKGSQTLVIAGGCFWGVEAVFEHVKGVTDVVSGYSGGEAKTATYDVVSGGRTGHAEAVSITFDPSQVTVGKLLKVFFSVAHDPTQLNYQGPDHGTQYRSAIFYKGDEQKQVADAYIDQLAKANIYAGKIVTQVAPLVAFYPAEAYHQNYLSQHPNQPYIMIYDMPKLEALKTTLPTLYRPA